MSLPVTIPRLIGLFGVLTAVTAFAALLQRARLPPDSRRHWRYQVQLQP
jgi:hypothetical protein